jgi:hypothetical protein
MWLCVCGVCVCVCVCVCECVTYIHTYISAGAQRRLISAIRNVLSLAHNSASRVAAQPLHKLEGLLVAQVA